MTPVDLLFFKHTIGTFNYGIVPAEAIGALGAIILCYLITTRGEEVRVLFLPMLFVIQTIGFQIGIVSLVIGGWFYVTTTLNLNVYGESLSLLDQSKKKRRGLFNLGPGEDLYAKRKYPGHQAVYNKKGQLIGGKAWHMANQAFERMQGK